MLEWLLEIPIQHLYTCPVSTTTVVHAVYISNVDGENDATVDVLVTDNSAVLIST